MLKKSSETAQLDIFTSPNSLFKGKVLNQYESELGWHNVFRNNVTMRIDETIFSPLFSKDQGRPNASIRVLIAMMILKEAECLSDQKIFENCRYNMLYRSALGLHNVDDVLPTESTYYLFRNKIVAYEREYKENLFSTVYHQITKGQCTEYEVSGRRVRMDSKLMGSNIAWMSRYELIHKTLHIFYNDITPGTELLPSIQSRLEELLRMDGNKVVYTHTGTEVKNRLIELGTLISQVLQLQQYSHLESYQTLKRVFEEQYKINEEKIVVARDKEEISAQSVQSPYDTDCTYRNKGGNDGQKKQEIKGYSINVTESCDEQGLNLITNVNVQKASTPDVDFMKDDLESSQEVLVEKIEAVHADGAYNSTDNQLYCKHNDIEMHLHAIQGAKGRYQLEMGDNNTLEVFDTVTNTSIANTQIVNKKGIIKWRIKEGKSYRYITQKEIDTYTLRKKIEKTPIEILQKRNNVEATIFQVGYHYTNTKSRYRGQTKHQMWANMRCLWVNFVRILKFKLKSDPKPGFFGQNLVKRLQIQRLVTTIFTFITWDSNIFQKSTRNQFKWAS